MEAIWDDLARVNAVNEALNRLPHDQIPIGLGFKLRHNPTYCTKCKAGIAVLELARTIDILKSGDPAIGEEINKGEVIVHDGGGITVEH